MMAFLKCRIYCDLAGQQEGFEFYKTVERKF